MQLAITSIMAITINYFILQLGGEVGGTME